MTRKGSLLALGIASLMLVQVPAHAAYGPAQLLFRLPFGVVPESSGFARSTLQPDIYWTHNDSPTPGINSLGQFYAIGSDGALRATFNVRGSFNGDWEDMAQGPGVLTGAPSLFFADIGDNLTSRAVRPFIHVYEVAEPEVGDATTVDVMPSMGFILEYADGPHNAESFMVDPGDGSFVIVTKDPDGRSGIYVSAGPATGGVRVMQRAADVNIAALASGTTSSYLNTTGGSIAPDRSRFVVRTYIEAFEWTLGDRSFAEALAQPPLRFTLPTTQQGEAIQYTPDSNDLLTSTEGNGAPVYLLPGT